jgi:hypothetical protein
VGVICEDGFVYHADSKGAHKDTLEKFCHGAEAGSYSIPNDGNYKAMLERAQSKVGAKYDFPAILWFGFTLLMKTFSIIVPKIVVNPKWTVCSEYANYIIFGNTETILPEELVDKVWELRDQNS